MDKQYIVALEIASSHIAGIVASLEEGGTASIVAYHEVPAADCVRYGCIFNVDEVCNKVRTLIDKIQSDRKVSPRMVRRVYVALSGKSLHTTEVATVRMLNESTAISAELVDELRRNASEGDGKQDVIAVMPKSFEIDGMEVENPIGSLGSSLRAVMNVVSCRPQIRRNIRMVFDRLGIEVADFVIAPIAAAMSLLTVEERRLGCMLVDHGAETTTVAIYKKDRLMYINVLPMGSRNITRDLMSLNMLEEMAENVKCTYGDAMSASVDLSKLDISGVSSLDVANYVSARAGEIMQNVCNQLSLASLTADQLPSGIVYVGRGMRLKRMPDLLESICGMPVRKWTISGVEGTALTNVPQLLAVIDGVAATQPFGDCLTVPTPPVQQVMFPQEPEDEPEEEQEETPKPEKKPSKKKKKIDFIKEIKVILNLPFEGDDENNNEK